MSRTSEGDPRVVLAINLVLSTVFSWIVISGLAFIDALAFSWSAVALLALLLAVVAHFVV